ESGKEFMDRGEAGQRRNVSRAERRDPGGGNDRSRGGKNGGERLRFVIVGGRAVPHPFLEVLDRAANAAPELRQPVGAEDEDDDDENDQQFRQTNMTHGLLLLKQAKTR